MDNRDVSPVRQAVSGHELKPKSQQIDVNDKARRYGFAQCACGCQTWILAYNRNGKATYFAPDHMNGDFTGGRWRRPAKDTRSLSMWTYDEAVAHGAAIPVSNIKARIVKSPEIGTAPPTRRKRSDRTQLDVAAHIKPKDVKQFYTTLRDIGLGNVTYEKFDTRSGKVVKVHPGPSESALIYLLNQSGGAPKPKDKQATAEIGSQVHVYLPARQSAPDLPDDVQQRVRELKKGQGITIDEPEQTLDTGPYAPNDDALADIERENE